MLTQLSYQCANHLASTVQTTTGTQDTTGNRLGFFYFYFLNKRSFDTSELTTPLFPCLAVRSPPIVSTPLSVPMTSSSPIVSVTEAQSTTSSPRSSPATSGTPSHYQSSSLIAVRSSIPSQATIPTSFNVGEVESTTVSSTESARSNQVETSIASHTGQMCQLLRIIHVSSFVLQKIFQHLSVADLLR